MTKNLEEARLCVKEDKLIDEVTLQMRDNLSTKEMAGKLVKKDTLVEKFRAESNSSDINSTALTANGIVHVDQLYDKPLTSFDPKLEGDLKVSFKDTTEGNIVPKSFSNIALNEHIQSFVFLILDDERSWPTPRFHESICNAS